MAPYSQCFRECEWSLRWRTAEGELVYHTISTKVTTATLVAQQSSNDVPLILELILLDAMTLLVENDCYVVIQFQMSMEIFLEENGAFNIKILS